MNRLKCFFGFHKWIPVKSVQTTLFFNGLEKCTRCGKFKEVIVSAATKCVYTEIMEKPYSYWGYK